VSDILATGNTVLDGITYAWRLVATVAGPRLSFGTPNLDRWATHHEGGPVWTVSRTRWGRTERHTVVLPIVPERPVPPEPVMPKLARRVRARRAA
jgi:hypothetical protein